MLQGSLNIRDSHPTDLEKLCGIDRICFPACMAFSIQEFHACLDHAGSIRVAETDEGIVGFVAVHVETNLQAHIITLDVVPQSRRCGIGFVLMRDMHHILGKRELSVSVLEVASENIAARRLYEKLQYRYVAYIPGYYGRCMGKGHNYDNISVGAHLPVFGKRVCRNASGDAFRMVRIF